MEVCLAAAGDTKTCRPGYSDFVDAGVDAGVRDAGVDAGTRTDGGTCNSGEECRASTGPCDVAETCTNDGVCPPDGVAALGTTCRASVGACDVAEVCDGTTVTCPVDRFLDPTTRCRVSAGPCDVDDFCNGNDSACPDTVRPSTLVCRAANGACDAEERCDGTSGVCPADGFSGNSVVCRAANGACDAEERCSGSSASCPGDGFAGNTVVCRAANGVCDVEERCDGSSAACPADGLAGNSVVCRTASGACDVEERCGGSSASCPSDGFAGASTQCAPLECSGGSFTFPRSCSGTSASCPPPGTQQSCGGFTCSSANACGTACANDNGCIASHFCQFGACTLRKADGQSCAIPGPTSECASGVCSQTYADADGDGIGAGGRTSNSCGATAPPGRSLVAGDCCDSDARAFPGATGFQATARTGCGGFDFNCDGMETQGDTTGNACQATACNVACSGGAGWLNGVAACGVTDSYVTSCNTLPCTPMSTQLRCAPILESRTQSCR